MVSNTVRQVIKKASILPPTQSLHVFKKYDDNQFSISNLIKYIEGFEKRMCLPLWRPKDFRNFMTENAFRQHYQDKCRCFLLKHSKSSQEHSYAPRQLLDEEIEAFREHMQYFASQKLKEIAEGETSNV